jgi:hypothetical protein
MNVGKFKSMLSFFKNLVDKFKFKIHKNVHIHDIFASTV